MTAAMSQPTYVRVNLVMVLGDCCLYILLPSKGFLLTVLARLWLRVQFNRGRIFFVVVFLLPPKAESGHPAAVHCTNLRISSVYTWLIRVFSEQAYDAVPGFPNVDLSVRVLGFWFVWLFTVPSLRARKPGEAEKVALNIAFLATPVISFAMPFITKVWVRVLFRLLPFAERYFRLSSVSWIHLATCHFPPTWVFHLQH